MNLAGDFRGKKGFCKYISGKRKAKENVPLLKGTGALMMQDMEKSEGHNAFFAPVISRKTGH